jgi:hypothetical protein
MRLLARIGLAFLFVAQLSLSGFAQDGIITTYAGLALPVNGSLAVSQAIGMPSSVAPDGAGGFYVASEHRVYRVSSDDKLIFVAGNGINGYKGDGGPATAAQLSYPCSMAVDSEGNLFIADYDNHCIRKATHGGIISTIAQSYSPYVIAVDLAGNLFIAEYYANRIREVTAGGIVTVAGNGSQGYSGDGGFAIAAKLFSPSGVAVDSAGNLFIADTINSCIRKVTPAGIISTVAGNGSRGYGGDSGPATSAQLNYPGSVAVDMAGNLFISDDKNNRIRKMIKLSVSTKLTVGAGGSATAGTIGLKETAQAGYATVAINSGANPYGTAVFSFSQSGVTVAEAGVPASPPTTAARIFIDYRDSVAAIPARISSGKININTGIAVVNNGYTSANVTYLLRNNAGTPLSFGHGTLAAGAHFAKFINQMNEVSPDFVLPANFQTGNQFASLEISSAQPLSILALRMTTNQRGEALFTTTPIADLTKSPVTSPIYFPQFADGGGYTTSIVLLNTSSGTETGTLQLQDDNGNPIVVTLAEGGSGSSFNYSIPTGGAFRFQTDGVPTTAKVGWVQVSPDTGASTPVGAGVFGYNPENVLVTESGVPAADATTHARIYVDLSAGHNTGLAIANPTSTNASITITAFQRDGVSAIGISQEPLQLSAKGHSAHFAGEFIDELPAEFTGVLDIVSTTSFAALTMRSLTNERSDFLLATFPVADMMKPAPSPIVFPHIADGGGYVSQFILIGAGVESSTTLNYYGEDGMPLAVGK